MNNMENNNSVCYVARINEIKPIPGADNIEQAIVGGWNCIVQKGQYAAGGLVVVATTDAVIPTELSDLMNVTNYLRKGGRVRTVKLRGVYSECLIIPLMYVPKGETIIDTLTEGKDMMEVMSIFKYEPPVRTISLGSGRKIRYQDNPNFHIYYKFPNLKNVDGMFTKDDIVEITRKIHGTNARYGIVKRSKVTLFHKLRKLFGNKWAEYEYVYGSHNVEKGSDSQGFYDTDVWAKVAEDYNIKNKLWNWVKTHVGSPNELGEGIILYGEIYGAGIQKGYDYGLTNMEFVGFDIKLNGEYMSTYDVYVGLDRLELPHVEELYIGQWNQEVQDSFVFNNYIKGTKVPHEGIVIKHISGNRSKVAKVINPDYLIYGEKHDIGDSH